MQRCRPVLFLGHRVSAVLDEELGHIDITQEGCPMQRCRPALVLGYRVGAVLDEEPGHIHMTP